jgi:outer membrane protein OmpA-like peptidoglycan-associated protein
MTKKHLLFLALFMFVFCLGINAQDDTYTAPNITDEMTVDTEQNKKWRMGQYKYSARPKHAWELGVHVGHFFIDGDVDRKLPAGYGVGLHLRRALHYAFSIRGDLFYGVAKGLDPQPWTTSNFGGGLVEPTFNSYRTEAQGWFPATKTTYIYGAMQAVVNIGNLLFHKERNKWNWYMAIGVGFDTHTAKLDLLDANGNPYANLRDAIGWTSELFDTQSGRKQIKGDLEAIYDGDYETDGFKKKGIFRIGDETNIHVVWTGSMGISRKISKRLNIGLEHQIMSTDNDYLDGIKFRTALDQTNNVDIGHYTNIRFGINLGNFNKVTEPLYWMNPYEQTFSDIAELKQRPVLDLTDADGDGIVDMMDQEIDSPAGCPVDTRGVTLDSDGDGLVDCKDQEPFSPPGYDVDSRGVAAVPSPDVLSEQDVVNIVESKTSAIAATVAASDCGEWFLPMIHFDLDRYYIKPEFYGQLHHVAQVLKLCPNLCVVAQGHTDNRNSNDYNRVLSFNRAKATIDYMVGNYGIARERFKLMYGGEESPLIQNATQEPQKYMNRRVEFRVCSDNDFEMARPDGPEAGQGAPAGKKFSGNKSSGY